MATNPFAAGLRPWARRTAAKLAAATDTLAPGELLVDEQGGVYAADGVTPTTALVRHARVTAVAAIVAASGPLATLWHTPVNATAGPLTMTLPTGQRGSTSLSVEKVDTTANIVTVSGNIRGVANATVSLALNHETVGFVADANGSWWPQYGHKTLSSLQSLFLKQSDAAAVYAQTSIANNTYATFPGSRAGVIGDSVDVSQESPTALSRNSSWFNYACIMSGQRFEYGFNAGIVGNTTAMMLARFDTDVTPQSPRVVVIGGGENDADPNQSVTLAMYAANITALVAKAHGIGAAVVLRTAMPYTGTGTNGTARRLNTAAINTWLRANAARLGAIALLDFFSLMVDPVTGQYLTAYDSGDGVHPNDAANAVMGAYAAETLTPLLPASAAFLAASNVDPANLITNGLFLGALGGANSDQPAGWYLSNPSTSAAVSLAAGICGNRLTLDFTNSGSEVYLIQQVSATALRGHQAIYSLRLTSALTAGMLGSFEVSSDGATPLFVRNTYNMAGQIPDGVAKVRFTVPSDATVLNVAHHIPAGATGRVTFAQATLNDLTALGAI